jgi:hypothetical protein
LAPLAADGVHGLLDVLMTVAQSLLRLQRYCSTAGLLWSLEHQLGDWPSPLTPTLLLLLLGVLLLLLLLLLGAINGLVHL